MKKQPVPELDFEIDRLTNSIQNTVSGDSFDTEVSSLKFTELKLLKKGDWVFDWRAELKDKTKKVFKLTIRENPNIVQGLLSLEDRCDHFFMHLIESAKFNKGKTKICYGVPGNLVAFACKTSKESGYEGVVSFFSKSRLVEHYKQPLRARVLFGSQMIIEEKTASRLIE